MPDEAPTILVADDDESNRTLLCDLLETEGYRVVTASDGEAALTIGRQGGVSLALLDVRMPGLTGLAVCRAFRTDWRTSLVPVILLSGLCRAEDFDLGLEAGADDFVGKPYLRRDLMARIRSLIGSEETSGAGIPACRFSPLKEDSRPECLPQWRRAASA